MSDLQSQEKLAVLVAYRRFSKFTSEQLCRYYVLLFSENSDLLRTMPEFSSIVDMLSNVNMLHPLSLKALEMAIDKKLGVEHDQVKLAPDLTVDPRFEPIESDDKHTGEPC